MKLSMVELDELTHRRTTAIDRSTQIWDDTLQKTKQKKQAIAVYFFYWAGVLDLVAELLVEFRLFKIIKPISKERILGKAIFFRNG